MRFRTVALFVFLLLASPAGGQSVCGTIDVTGAILTPGTAPTAGTVTIEPCGAAGTRPTPPPIGMLGAIGVMNGSLPAFPGAGTGADGAFHATEDATLPGGTYNFTTYQVDNLVTVTYSGAVVILTTGDVDIAGHVITNADSAPITFQCGGTFRLTGTTSRAARVEASGLQSAVTIAAAEDFEGTARADVECREEDLTITAHGETAGTGNVTLDQGDVWARARKVTIIAADSMSLSSGQVGGEGGLVIQTWAGTYTQDGEISVGTGATLQVEAHAGITTSGGSYVTSYGGPLMLASFNGSTDVSDTSVESNGGHARILASQDVTIGEFSNLTVGDGQLTVGAFGGDATVSGAYMTADAGTIEIKASDSVHVVADGQVHTRSGNLQIRAFGGDFTLNNGSRIGRGVFDHGSVEIWADHRILCGVGAETEFVHGSSVMLSAGMVITLYMDYLRADAGDVTMYCDGDVTISCGILAWGDVSIYGGASIALDALVDKAWYAYASGNGSIETLDRGSGEGNSGSVLIESWGGALGSISVPGPSVSEGIKTGASDTQSGDITLRIRHVGGVVESFVLPKRVVLKINAKKPERSKLIAAGWCDLGPKAVNFAAPATIEAGDVVGSVDHLEPIQNGKAWRLASDGLVFTLKPNPTGSSRAKFKLKVIGDLEGKVDPDAVLPMRFACDVVDGKGSVTLTKGKYALRKVRGALVEPNLHLVKTKAKIKGGGMDSAVLILGLATSGPIPADASDLTIGFGEQFEATVPADAFVKSGEKFVYKGGADGIVLAIVDYRKEVIRVKVKNADLGDFLEGANEVDVEATLGADQRGVRVRMVRKKASLRY